MPRLDEIAGQNTKRGFKKREYRPWDLDGDSNNSLKNPKILDEADLNSEDIIEVDCHLIVNWEHNDRPFSELGNIENLANEFKQIGQLQPCIVRPTLDSSKYKYELIVGERRWRAAQMAKLCLKVIVKNLSDTEAAIIQASENFNRLDISDFSRGMSYAKLIDKNIITSNDLIEKLGISKQQLSRLLSFSKLPQEIIDAIGDMSKVSARTAEHLKQVSARGEKYINIIVRLADRIGRGKIGHYKISELIEKETSKADSEKAEDSKIYSKTGLPLFTIKYSSNLSPSFHFNKDVVALLERKNVTAKNVATKLSQVIEGFIYGS